jgi:hypothetical protein
MRRLTLVFALIALVSAAMRMVVPERMVQVTRIQRVFTRACQFFTKQLRPLLPMAN